MLWFSFAIGAVLGTCAGMIVMGVVSGARIQEAAQDAWQRGIEEGQVRLIEAIDPRKILAVRDRVGDVRFVRGELIAKGVPE